MEVESCFHPSEVSAACLGQGFKQRRPYTCLTRSATIPTDETRVCLPMNEGIKGWILDLRYASSST